jgi:hypothetical protein
MAKGLAPREVAKFASPIALLGELAEKSDGQKIVLIHEDINWRHDKAIIHSIKY